MLARLLIEPVWNGNSAAAVLADSPVAAFNRTSLEWKLIFVTVWYNLRITFNRTSLEWKRRIRFALFLLMRSTFNRTSLEWKLLRAANNLNSSDSFNRTSLEWKRFLRSLC